MFSSAARSVLQVILGVKIFGDIITAQRAMSVLTILLGTLLYTWAKSREAPPEPKEPVLPMTDVHKTGSTGKSLGLDGHQAHEKLDNVEIFATGAHDSDEEANVHTRKPQ